MVPSRLVSVSLPCLSFFPPSHTQVQCHTPKVCPPPFLPITILIPHLHSFSLLNKNIVSPNTYSHSFQSTLPLSIQQIATARLRHSDTDTEHFDSPESKLLLHNLTRKNTHTTHPHPPNKRRSCVTTLTLNPHSVTRFFSILVLVVPVFLSPRFKTRTKSVACFLAYTGGHRPLDETSLYYSRPPPYFD